MKVSILTYHWEDNYGATLQAYATSKAIEKLGHLPEFIDLRLPYKPSIKSRIIFLLKRHRFNSFRNKYFCNRTPKTYWSVEDLKADPPKSDCYLVGSDQTWNPQIGKSLLPAFFLTFGSNDARRITYATSIGLNEWEKSKYISNSEITEALKKFNKILLREDSGIRILKENFGIRSSQVIDPVLLFPSYPELTKDIKLSDEIVTYKLISDEKFYRIAKEIANSLSLPIRSIGSVRKPAGYRASYPESVENWIKRIASASLVLTDSFHGTVLSILYHRPFVVYIGDPERVTRIESLLKQLDLSDRILTGNDSFADFLEIISKQIQWETIDQRIQTLRQESFQLLDNALNE